MKVFAVFNGKLFVAEIKLLKEVCYHGESLGISYDNSIRIFFHELLNVRGVVGFHVLNYEIVRGAVAENF